MDINVSNQFSLLARGGDHTVSAMRQLCQAMDRYPKGPDRLRFVEGLATQFEKLPSALDKVIQMLENNVVARLFLGAMLAGGGSVGKGYYCESFKRFLCATPHGVTAVRGLVKALAGNASVSQRMTACYGLRDITGGNKTLVRLAADEGAIDLVVELLQHPNGQDPGSISATTALLDNLVHDSNNRATKAAKAGAIQALTTLLTPSTPSPRLFNIILPLHSIFTAALPTDAAPLKTCIDPLASVLGRGDACEQTVSMACRILWLVCKVQSLSSQVGTALKHAGAIPALVQDASRCRGPVPSALMLLTWLLAHHPEQATAVAEAGGIEMAQECLRRAEATPAAPQRGMVPPGMTASLEKSTAQALLHILANENPAYAAVIGDPDEMLAALERSKAVVNKKIEEAAVDSEARMSMCAACGARSGGGKGGALQQCSACKGVAYCSRGCQVRHWKVHRKICVAGEGRKV